MKAQLLTVLVLAGAVLASGVGVVYTRHVNRQFFIQLQKLQAERDTLDVEWESLQLEQSTLVMDAAVEEKARQRLNMMIPDPADVFYIKPPDALPISHGFGSRAAKRAGLSARYDAARLGVGATAGGRRRHGRARGVSAIGE